jgi:DNA-binding transcriptional MerR regulator
MRISDLSRESGVSIPTIKFYLREGLIPPGVATAPNQARYDERHLRRLRLIRVLTDVGGLSLAATRRVLVAIDGSGNSLHDVLAEAHGALRRDDVPPGERGAAARRETDAWLASTGWALGPDSPARDDLAATLVALRDLGWQVGPEVFERYRRAADGLAEAEIDYVAGMPDPSTAVEATVTGTIVFERAFAALRRLAQEHHSRRRFGKRR